jgi:ParB-like chromosome segregation protein Spo0J
VDNTLDQLLHQDEAAAVIAAARDLFAGLAGLDEDTRMDAVNQLRLLLREHSPMKDEPVDCIQWVPADQVAGNEYNPNVVAPPEMKLLALSIKSDGFTQPIVAWPVENGYEVVDGFHRHRIGKEDKAVRKRLRGRLPIAVINSDRTDREDRQASTIRHNRARGQHTVEGMSEIVVELARRGKTDQWIGRELGLDPDEVRRLRQITGLAEMFAEQEFSEAWEAEDPWSADR